MAQENLSFVLAERPNGDIIAGKTLAPKKSPIPSASDLQDGQVLVEVLYLSLDPAMRGWMSEARSYVPPVKIGETMRGSTVCRVVASKGAKFNKGDFVSGTAGWTQYAILDEKHLEPTSSYPGLQDPIDMLSALGFTSLTAWVGMTKIGLPKAGETVVVSGAAGATGSVAGQIAKIAGARVVGLCGSDVKCKWLVDELGFDIALNYKAADFKDRFKEATKSYIDVYFDNVGGEILDMALGRAKEHARFVECGQISQYNTSTPKGQTNISKVVTMRIRMEGFIIFDHIKDYPRARKELAQWLAEGKLKKTEHVLGGGLEVAEQGLIDLYKGVNQGKLIVEVKPKRHWSGSL
ncbi:zinc-binding dehydrogenase [Hirsutella rhossiliensis]|uniref:Dehydrogenase FUB6 n=1 Tax=Hirsutella rhossiliensis TaxID=111463 RepID=A0A9P8MVJ3_9HYPO|nr:zinc-binding dehydrogenase domain-containing protein [Hirsutella rhossiliensis]KAH0962050.1 zinc-binding dehydrogenase domain-containing protein [Hirsutella rhossiliensis]